MALDDRNILSMQGSGRVSVPRNFVHIPATGMPAAPTYLTPKTFTAVAATDLITSAAHGLAARDRVVFSSTTTLPAGLSPATDYFVIASGLDADHFRVSAVDGGTTVDITGTGTGTHSWLLNAQEIKEINDFLTSMNSGGLSPSDPTYPASTAKIAAFLAYYATPAYMNWWFDNQHTREQQWLLRRVDANVASNASLPGSGDVLGTGSGAPAVPIPLT